MKKKFIRVTAGALAACVMLGVPLDVQASARDRSSPIERWEIPDGEPVEEDFWFPVIPSDGGGQETGPAEEVSSQAPAGDEQASQPEETETPEGGTSENETSEIASDELKLEEKQPDQVQILGQDIIDSEAYVRIIPEMTANGEFDYRSCVDNDMKAELEIKLEHIIRYDLGDGEKVEKKRRWLSEEELKNYEFEVTITDTGVLRIEDGAERNYKDGKSCTYILSQNKAGLVIAGTGKTDYTIRPRLNKEYTASLYNGYVTVNNGSLYDTDFYIRQPNSGKVYTFGEWKKYLEKCGGWLNDNFEAILSETGKKYFDNIRMEASGEFSGLEIQQKGIGKNAKLEQYIIWAEKCQAGVCTKGEADGTRSFYAGIDKTAPVLRRMFTRSKCYEPTKTDTEQYFSEDFVLEGVFLDDSSGVERVEYTTDVAAGKNAIWLSAEKITPSKEKKIGENGETREVIGQCTNFRIVLPDGIHKAVAVRAYDRAGNVSAESGFVNDDGEYIKVVVDKSEPVVDIKGIAGGLPYSGDNDSWTNKDVMLKAVLEKGSCPYAGIYKCEYFYDKIGDAVNRKNMTDVSEKWTLLAQPDGQDGVVEITDDRNGYYYFRAVSKSGVVSKNAAKARVLVQHKAAGVKPVIVNDVDASRRKNDWYNKASGVPVIRFEYPDYDEGAVSGEYDAPVMVHYKLTIETGENGSTDDTADKSVQEKSAEMGVLSCSDVETDTDGVKKFVLTKDSLESHVINFGFDSTTNEARDGIYTLEYWVTDRAGNTSEKQTQVYRIDCHEPTDLTVELEGSVFEAGKESGIVYERFYKDSVSGNVSAGYGISGKGSLTVLKAKKIGGWKDAVQGEEPVNDNGVINIGPNTRCFLYVRAEDGAGNVSEGWTKGLVVDNMAPNQENNKELIIEPVGANKHGFYRDDVKVEISVRDSPDDDNCAALESVTGTIGKDGKDTVSGRELFSFTKEFPTDEELVKASAFEGVQVVSAKDNESNEAYIEVTAVDRSGNTKTSTQLLKIDITRPQIDISFDNNEAVNGSFYHDARTATIHVKELNFDPSAVDIRVTKDGQAYDYKLSEWTSDGVSHYASITFAEDGGYAVEAKCTDLAGNESGTAAADFFTIDRTAPELAVEMRSGQAEVYRDGYFNGAVTAVITVKEHNFDSDGLSLDASVSPKGTWHHDGDVHTFQFSYDGDGTHHISCVYTDKAGNMSASARKNFVIDTEAPQIAIGGLVDGAAVNGELMPVITVLDFNMEVQDTSVAVTTGTGEFVDTALETAAVSDGSGVGYHYTLTDINDKPDNIYYLTVSAHDSAGNEASLTYRFSLNRKGSAYDLTQLVDLMSRRYVTYAGLGDICIVEMNIDTVEDFAIYISRNGELGYKAKYDREMQGSADTGYTYIYHVRSDNFEQEGTYKLTLYSKDRAGNEVNNKKDINGSEIQFIIDNTVPKVVIDGVEAGMLYDAESKEVHVSVADNFMLSEAEFTLVNRENEVIGSWDYMESCKDGGQLDITIPQYNGEVSLLYRVKDAAGNEVQTFQGERTALSGILVTTDKVVQFMNKPSKTPAGRALSGIMGIMAAMAAITGMGIIRRKKIKIK